MCTQDSVNRTVYSCQAGGDKTFVVCLSVRRHYFKQCLGYNVHDVDSTVLFFCLEIQCPANSHFEPQGTACPATCVNQNSTQGCPLPVQESCLCNSGYILSAGICIPHAECGCRFEGSYYCSGVTVILDEDCRRRCTCSYGSMTCRPHGCGPLESCRVEEGERGCRPNSYGTCWMKGPGSYYTFDGLTYQYPGACRLTLAKVMGLSSYPHFAVTAEKLPAGQQGFSRLLKFEAMGIQVSIEMASSSRVMVSLFNRFF